MTIYFAGSAPADFDPQTPLTLIAGSGSPDNAFDATAVPACLTVDAAQLADAILSQNVSEAWFHFVMNPQAMMTTKSFLRVKNFAQRDAGAFSLVRLRAATNATGSSALSGTFTAQLDFLNAAGTGYTNVGSAFTISCDARTTFDLHVKLHASAGRIAIYKEGTLMAEFTGDTMPSAAAADGIDLLQMCGSFSPNEGAVAYAVCHSEMIIASESTINWRLVELTPTGAGANSGWAGAYTAVDDVNNPGSGGSGDNDIITAATAGLKSTFVMSDVNASFNGLAVAGVGVVARVRKGATGPQNLAGVARIGGTDYDSANVAPASNYTAKRALWETSPATSGAWTIAEINAAEFGIKAVA